MTKKAAKKQKSKAKVPTPRARQSRLPGTDDAEISELQDAAMDYADVRDRRMELNKQEVELKGRIINLMHKNGKDHYSYQGVEIRLVVEQEGVKVRVNKPKADENEAEAA